MLCRAAYVPNAHPTTPKVIIDISLATQSGLGNIEAALL